MPPNWVYQRSLMQKYCHAAIRIRRVVALIPPREEAAFWERGHPRNLAVDCQKLYDSNKYWKERYGYHKHSLSETAMYRVKQLLGGRLSLRHYNAQVDETYSMVKVLNKLTGLGMPKTLCVGWCSPEIGRFSFKSELRNIAHVFTWIKTKEKTQIGQANMQSILHWI